MRHSPFSLAPVCAAALLFLPATSFAEINIAESIEWVVGDADRVFSGKVVKVEEVHKDATTFEVATVEVSRAFKGDPAVTVTFLLRSHNKGAAQGWLEDGVPLLFCLVATDRVRGGTDALPAGFDWVIRDGGNNPSAYLLGKPKRRWTYTIDALTRTFEVLTEPAAITRHAEEYLKSIPGGWKKQSHAVYAPGHTAVYEKLWCGSAVLLEVPVDGELERLGRQWCQSDSEWLRADGAKILRHFKNDQNIAILKTLLQDPTSSIRTTHTSKDGHGKVILVSRQQVYRVRTEAFKALQEFGVDVDPPMMEKRLDAKDDDDEASEQTPVNGVEQPPAGGVGRGVGAGGTMRWLIAGGIGAGILTFLGIVCLLPALVRHRSHRSRNSNDSVE